MKVLKKFKSIFEGSDKAHGVTRKTGEIRADGKNEVVSKTIQRSATDQMWMDHLNGSDPALGIIPIRSNNTCIWGCIDWDVYPLNHKQIAQDLKRKQIPLTVFRSKSGGAHLFLFVKEPVQASMMRNKLKEFAAAIGHARAEIFPKQEKITQNDVGSFLNLPYHNIKNTVRYAFDFEGNPILEVEQFFDHYDKTVLSVEDFKNLKLNDTGEDDFLEMPPCLITLLKNGVSTGIRNDTLYNVAVYVKKRYHENAKTREEKLSYYNTKYFNPPIVPSEVTVIFNSVETREYFYKCKNEPLVSFCNSKVCVTRKFGVGDGEEPQQTITSIRKYNSDPPLFFCDIDGQTVSVDTKTLHDPDHFSMACLEQIGRPQMPMAKMLWRKMLIKLLAEKEETDTKATDDLKIDNQMMEYLEEFINKINGKSINDIQRGVPYTEDGHSWFKMKDFWRYLIKNKWPDKRYPKNFVVQKLQAEVSLDLIEDWLKINNKTVRCFKITTIKSNTPAPSLPESKEPAWKRTKEQ